MILPVAGLRPSGYPQPRGAVAEAPTAPGW